MAIGSRLLGSARAREFKILVYCHEGFALLCAAIFVAIAYIGSEASLEAEFVNAACSGLQPSPNMPQLPMKDG